MVFFEIPPLWLLIDAGGLMQSSVLIQSTKLTHSIYNMKEVPLETIPVAPNQNPNFQWKQQVYSAYFARHLQLMST